MRVFIDNNLSHRLRRRLPLLLGDAVHARDLGWSRVSDDQIWTYARERQMAILTRDDDFVARVVRYGFPPKVIRVFDDNGSNATIAAMLDASREAIEMFFADPNAGLLEIDG